MRHPTEGTLRRLVDEPAGVADADRRHAADCPTCLAALAHARTDASLVAAALTPGTAAGAGTDRAWQRLAAAAAAPATRAAPAAAQGHPGMAARRRGRRWAALRSPVVAAVGVAALLGGASTAAAADWLQIFRAETVAPVAVDAADLVSLPDLSAYGDVRVLEPVAVREVTDGATATRRSGILTPRVEQLPRGVTGGPTYVVGARASSTFTFSAAKAARAVAATGKRMPPPPAGLDGSTVRLVAGPGLAATWRAGSGAIGLVVARVVAPTAYVRGVPLATARDYLLSLPGVPDDLAAQLRAFSDDGSTLPLPVPVDRVRTSQSEVNGAPATVFTSRDGALAGVVWVDGGEVVAVAGTLGDDEVLEVARGLRWGG